MLRCLKERTVILTHIINQEMISGSLSPQHGTSSGCGWRNGLRYGW